MKEQIKTDCCGKCSLFNFSYINTCRHPKTKGMVIEDVNKINKGCPLNDVKEE
jgi:hypothetical protein